MDEMTCSSSEEDRDDSRALCLALRRRLIHALRNHGVSATVTEALSSLLNEGEENIATMLRIAGFLVSPWNNTLPRFGTTGLLLGRAVLLAARAYQTTQPDEQGTLRVLTDYQNFHIHEMVAPAEPRECTVASDYAQQIFNDMTTGVALDDIHQACTDYAFGIMPLCYHPNDLLPPHQLLYAIIFKQLPDTFCLDNLSKVDAGSAGQDCDALAEKFRQQLDIFYQQVQQNGSNLRISFYVLANLALALAERNIPEGTVRDMLPANLADACLAIQEQYRAGLKQHTAHAPRGNSYAFVLRAYLQATTQTASQFYGFAYLKQARNDLIWSFWAVPLSMGEMAYRTAVNTPAGTKWLASATLDFVLDALAIDVDDSEVGSSHYRAVEKENAQPDIHLALTCDNTPAWWSRLCSFAYESPGQFAGRIIAGQAYFFFLGAPLVSSLMHTGAWTSSAAALSHFAAQHHTLGTVASTALEGGTAATDAAWVAARLDSAHHHQTEASTARRAAVSVLRERVQVVNLLDRRDLHTCLLRHIETNLALYERARRLVDASANEPQSSATTSLFEPGITVTPCHSYMTATYEETPTPVAMPPDAHGVHPAPLRHRPPAHTEDSDSITPATPSDNPDSPSPGGSA